MGIGFPKPEPRVYAKRAQRLKGEEQERECREAVRKRDKGRCRVPGCKEKGTALHHITFRSRGGRWTSGNITSLCQAHHALVHAHKITISGDADDELIITGDKKDLAFRL